MQQFRGMVTVSQRRTHLTTEFEDIGFGNALPELLVACDQRAEVTTGRPFHDNCKLGIIGASCSTDI